MRIDHTNINLDIAIQAVRSYNSGCYAGSKNTELDKRGRELFATGIASSLEGVERQVRFIGVDYGGAAGFKAAYTLVPAIARAIHDNRDRYNALASEAHPIIEILPAVEVVKELLQPFIQIIHGKRNWHVWASKFLHFLNSDAFPVEDSRVDKFFRLSGNRRSPENYVTLSARFREFAISHRSWLPQLREADEGFAWCDNKLWDKVCFGVAELE